MELTVERNGRKFNVDWKMMNRWCDVNQEFKVGDCCFVLEFSSLSISTDLIDDSIIVGIVLPGPVLSTCRKISRSSLKVQV